MKDLIPTVIVWAWIALLLSCLLLTIACFRYIKQNEILREQLREFVVKSKP